MCKKSCMYLITGLVFLSGIFSGCSGQKPSEDTTGEMVLDVVESPEENFEINLHKDFSEYGEVVNYVVRQKDFSSSDDVWIDNMLEKYFDVPLLPDKEEIYIDSNTNKRTKVVFSEKGSFMFAPSVLLLKRNQTFSENISYYYRAAGVEQFFSEETDSYYSQKDLDFMSYEAAKSLSEEIIEDIGYEYYKDGCKGYAFDNLSLNRYREDHEQEFKSLKTFLEDIVKMEFIDSLKKEDDFYLFYFPCALKGIELLPSQMYPLTWAYVIINKDGLSELEVNSVFEIVEQQDAEIISAKQILEKLKTMYQNMILTQNIKVYDMQLQYGFTKFEEETKEYEVSPIWKFYVLMENIPGEFVEASVSYNAITGERIS